MIRRLFGELLEHKARRATNLLVSDVCVETHTRNDMFTHVSHPSEREREGGRKTRALMELFSLSLWCSEILSLRYSA